MSALREAVENTASEALHLLHEARFVSLSEIAMFRQASPTHFGEVK
jgi:hypothetical protein